LHYDPLYERAIDRNFPRYRGATSVVVPDAAPVTFRHLAQQLLAEPVQPDVDKDDE